MSDKSGDLSVHASVCIFKVIGQELREVCWRRGLKLAASWKSGVCVHSAGSELGSGISLTRVVEDKG